MNYRPFGKTGFDISTLGFGAMRLPQKDVGGKKVYDHEESARILRRAFDLGVNYFDTGYFYCNKESETIVGKAIKGWRDSIKVSTKLPIVDDSNAAYVRKMLDQSLKALDIDHIDFYHLWGIGWELFENKIKGEVLDEVLKAKSEGLIRHLSFSFHDKPESMIKLVDTGLFESVLCQYNLLDRANEQAIAHAHAKGLGVVIMGPVAGGRLGAPSPAIQSLLPGGSKSSAETALRFVLANPDISCALSGMSSMAMVEENAEVASRPAALTERERANVLASMEEMKKLADLYCTGCGYCMPCPQNVDIPRNLELMNLHRVYGLTETARNGYRHLGTGGNKERLPASSCIECGLCEEKCPQKIEIRKRLKETDEAIGK